jgi:heme exporter protein B
MLEGHEAGFLSKTWALVRKDLTIEFRARATLPPMVAFVLAVTVLLAFALPAGGEPTAPVDLPTGAVPLADVLAGFLWVTVLFSGLIGFARTFEVERSTGALDPLLLVPLDRSGLFVAKAIANLVFVLLVEVLLFPVFALLFAIDIGADWAVLVLVTLLADLGFVAIGTLFASVAAQTRSRELILPVLALPALVPLFIGATELTSALFLGEGAGSIVEAGWFAILAAFAGIFSVVGALAADFVLD